MAIAAAAEWDATTTGSNDNGGFFVTGASGTDFSQQTSPQYALTGLTTGGATAVVTYASAAADMVGNGFKVVSGTNATVGWYEIISVSVGVSFTVDRNWCSGAVAGDGVGNVGGSVCLTDANVDTMLEAFTIGNILHVKSGTHALGATVNVASNGGTSSPKIIRGYNTTHGDNPLADTRPLITTTVGITFGNNWNFEYLRFHTATDSVHLLTITSANKIISCKFTNYGTVAGFAGILSAGVDNFVYGCELVSLFGSAINTTNGGTFHGNWFHHSDKGLTQGTTATVEGEIEFNIISDCTTHGLNLSVGTTSFRSINNNTIVDNVTNRIIGIEMASGTTDTRIFANHIVGCSKGIDHNTASAQTVGFDDYNNYYNCTTDVENWIKGPNSIDQNPGFVNVGAISTSSATTSGGVWTDGSANFSTVTDNVDYLTVISGTGVTVGHYLITAHTTTTLTLSPAIATNATADKVGHVTTGHNYTPSSTFNFYATNSTFPGGFTSNYRDIGAVQRRPGVFPSQDDVRDGEQYGAGGTQFTGNMTLPSGDDVRDGEQYGTSGTEITGNLELPLAADVESGVQYGTNGTEFTGTLSGGAAAYTFIG